MSQLHELLGDLVRQQSERPPLLQELSALEAEKDLLLQAISEARQRHKSFVSALKTLEYLMRQSRLDEVLRLLGEPGRLLGGPIDLTRVDQKPMVAELSVRLQANPGVDSGLRQLLRAIHLFYDDYYDEQGRSPVEDRASENALREFSADLRRGARREYVEYTDYLEKLNRAEEGSAFYEELDAELPAFHVEMDLQYLSRTRSAELREHLLKRTPWTALQQPGLENIFVEETRREILDLAFNIFDIRCCGCRPEFLERLLAGHEMGELATREYLKKCPTDKLETLLRNAIENNWKNLFDQLINMVECEPGFFYRSLGERPLSPEIFTRILDTLFAPNSPRQRYGIDSNYARKIFGSQNRVPRNVLKVLQKAFPRGIDPAPFKGFLEVLEAFNRECEEFTTTKDRRENHQDTRTPDYIELCQDLSAVETIRYVIFTYIYDSAMLQGGARLKIGLDKWQNFLVRQLEFERAVGHNRNITAYATGLLDHFFEPETAAGETEG